eukprot:4386553-Amphidinium_carterae.1
MQPPLRMPIAIYEHLLPAEPLALTRDCLGLARVSVAGAPYQEAELLQAGTENIQHVTAKGKSPTDGPTALHSTCSRIPYRCALSHTGTVSGVSDWNAFEQNSLQSESEDAIRQRSGSSICDNAREPHLTTHECLAIPFFHASCI